MQLSALRSDPSHGSFGARTCRPVASMSPRLPMCFKMLGRSSPLVHMSLGLSTPGILATTISPLRTFCCTHKSATARWRTRPSPSRRTIPIAAVASENMCKLTSTPKSARTAFRPNPSAAPLTTAASSASPELRAMVAWVLLQLLIPPNPNRLPHH